MSASKEPIERLMDAARIKGQSRMIPDTATPDTITKDQGEAVTRAVLQYMEQNPGITRSHIARSIGVAGSTLGCVLNWKYPGAWQEIVIDLDRWLEEQIKRDEAPKNTSFVMTKVAEEIYTVADIASTLKTIGLVYGPTTSGIGKTMSLQALAAHKPGAVLVTVEKMTASTNGLIRAIAQAMRISDNYPQRAYRRIKEALQGGSRLLMIDQIHNLCGAKDDRPLFMLADLHDMTGAPQLWCGTSDIVSYLERGQAKGKDPLSQLRRRIGIARDLLERTRRDGGGDGEPLYTVDEIRKVFGRGQMRLASDAARYLCLLANTPDSGALGMCRNLMVMATTIYGKKEQALTAEHLRAVHRMLVSRRIFQRMENEISETTPIARAG